MSDQGNVQLVGVPQAQADVERWAAELGAEIERAAEPLARRVADVVAARVPHLTGQLAGSIETTSETGGAGVGYDGSAEYAGWIEFGGSRGRTHIPEGRYLYPTAEAAADEFEQLAASTAESSAGRFAWSTPSK